MAWDNKNIRDRLTGLGVYLLYFGSLLDFGTILGGGRGLIKINS